MKTTREDILRKKEEYEQLRLKMKYEEMGYEVSFPEAINEDRKQKYIPDLYAINKETGEEIVFEIKSRTGLKKIKKGDILELRNRCLEHYKNAKFILVLPDEVKEDVSVDSKLNDLLLNFIKETKLEYFQINIQGFFRLEHVEEVVLDKVDFNDFKSINVSGEANLKFYIERNEGDLNALNISDGIPFQFNLTLTHNQFSDTKKTVYTISEESRITFDLSEFVY